jgi:hypothetical protein
MVNMLSPVWGRTLEGAQHVHMGLRKMMSEHMARMGFRVLTASHFAAAPIGREHRGSTRRSVAERRARVPTSSETKP